MSAQCAVHTLLTHLPREEAVKSIPDQTSDTPVPKATVTGDEIVFRKPECADQRGFVTGEQSGHASDHANIM